MISRLLIVSILIFVWSGAGAAETYRWEDADGNVHYSDFPPPPDAHNVGRAKAGSKAPSPSLPYELRVAVSKYPVTLYVTDCGDPCDNARELLIERGVPHTLLDALKPDVRRRLKALPGGILEVPVAEVGELVLRGFDAGRWNSMLDSAGYPRDAMIEVTPNVPQGDDTDVDNTGANDTDADDADLDSVDSDDADSDDAESDDAESESVDADDTSAADEETENADEQ